MDKRYLLHASQLFTKADGEALRADLARIVAESQRLTITAVFAAVGIFAALTKILH